MDLKLTREQKHLKKDIIRFAKEKLNVSAVNDGDPVARSLRTLWQACADQRLQGMFVPELHAGSSYSAEQGVIALQGLGYGCQDESLLSVLGSHLAGCAAPLCRYGSEAQQKRYLPGLTDGTWIGASAVSSLDSEFLAGIPIAVRDGDDFVFEPDCNPVCVNTAQADVFVFYALTGRDKDFDEAITCFVLDKNDTGVEVEPAPTRPDLSVVSMGNLSLAGVRVTAEQIVGSPGQGVAIYREAVAWQRTIFAALQVGRMDQLLEATLGRLRSHQSREASIGKHQSVSHAVTDMKIRLEVARLLNFKAAWQLDQGKAGGKEAAISKLFSSESAMQSSIDAMQIFGRHGLLDDAGIGLSVHGALGNLLNTGSPAIQRDDIAREMGLHSSAEFRVANFE